MQLKTRGHCVIGHGVKTYTSIRGLTADCRCNRRGLCRSIQIQCLLVEYDDFSRHQTSSLFEVVVMKFVKKAVFPVAGFGTRFLPATKAMPKELLPIVDKPLIQYAAEEAIAACIDTLVFVTGRNKRAIEDHFDNNQELEMALRAKGKNTQADMVKNILPEGVECIFVRQPEQLGLGHAVLCAERAVGNNPFAVLLADDFLTYDYLLRLRKTDNLVWKALPFFITEMQGGGASGLKHTVRRTYEDYKVVCDIDIKPSTLFWKYLSKLMQYA